MTSPSKKIQDGIFARSRKQLMKIGREIWEDLMLRYPGNIAVMEALDVVGIGHLENIGVRDERIYGWLSSHKSNHYKDKHGCGDVHSVLLNSGREPGRYERVMRPAVGSQIFADVYADSYRKKWEQLPEFH